MALVAQKGSDHQRQDGGADSEYDAEPRSGSENVRSLVPVSYTHLDVYKRQGFVLRLQIYERDLDSFSHFLKPRPK